MSKIQQENVSNIAQDHFISTCIALRNPHSRVAQWERAGPITQRSMDQNHSLLCFFSSPFSFFLLFFPLIFAFPLFPFILFPIFPPPVFFLLLIYIPILPLRFPIPLPLSHLPFCLVIQQCCEYNRLGNRRKYRPLELGQKMLEGK